MTVRSLLHSLVLFFFSSESTLVVPIRSDLYDVFCFSFSVLFYTGVYLPKMRRGRRRRMQSKHSGSSLRIFENMCGTRASSSSWPPRSPCRPPQLTMDRFCRSASCPGPHLLVNIVVKRAIRDEKTGARRVFAIVSRHPCRKFFFPLETVISVSQKK